MGIRRVSAPQWQLNRAGIADFARVALAFASDKNLFMLTRIIMADDRLIAAVGACATA